MQSQNRMFDDFVKVMNGAAGTLAGMTREAQATMQERAREWIGGLDMVSREEFDAARLMALAAREENEALKQRLDTLEAIVAGLSARTAPARASRKSAEPPVGEG